MTQFAIFATLLIVVAAAFILPPLWFGRRAQNNAPERREANLAIFRDQLAELEREKSDGTLAETDYSQAQRELQRRMLEEVSPTTAGSTSNQGQGSTSRKTAIVVLLLLPVLSLLGYGLLGNLRALDPVQVAGKPKMTAEQIAGMVNKLAERLKANPDDMQGWLMLARSYKTMGRYEEAAEAYGKAEKAINDDPEMLANYAETLGMANGNQLKGKPRQLIERALKLDPKHTHSIFLAGAAAMEAGENKRAVAYWESLLPLVEADSEIDKMLRGGIEKMKQGK